MGGLTAPRPLVERDDRNAFDCGRESLNRWLGHHAWRNQVSGVSRVSVVCDSESGAIAGYTALGAAQIERSYLPKALQRNQPDPIPTILLGQLAVDLRYQGLGCAKSLLFFALSTSMHVSQSIGCYCVLTHPLDDEVRDLYHRFGFRDLPFDPKRGMMVRIVDLKASGFGG